MLLNSCHNIDGRVYKECLTLTKDKHEVIILALENENLSTEEFIGGAKVMRLIRWPKIKIPILRQFLFSFVWIKNGLLLDVDAYHAHDADVLFEASICARLKGKKLIFDSHELFLNMASLENKKISRFVWWLKESFGIKRADKVIITNKERRDILVNRYKFIKNKVTVLENFPSLYIGRNDDFNLSRKETRKMLNIGVDKIVFIFQGSLNSNRGLEILLEAMNFSKLLSKAVFLIVGDGDYRKKLQQKVDEKSYKNFIFTGRVNYFDLPKYLAAADVGIVYFPDICLNYRYAAPNKLYEYMLNRLAILSNNVVTIKNVINKESNGFFSEKGDGKGFAQLIDQFSSLKENELNIMKNNSYHAAINNYNWEAHEEKLINLYKEI